MGRPVFHLGRYRESRRGLSRPGDCPDFRAAKMGLSPSARVTPYDVVRIVLGLILLTAAALKGHQLATGPVAETSLFTSRWFLIGVVELELFFGLWLLSGLYPRRTWQAALVCFSAFACVSLYKALSGEATCGCFGRVPVNPWYTLVLDLAAAAALVLCRPARRAKTSPLPLSGEGPGVRAGASLLQVLGEGPGVRVCLGTRLGWVLGIFLAAGIPAALAMGSYQAATLDDAGDIFGDSEFIVLEPETWISKPFPLVRYIDIGDQIARGEWIVVLYRWDCPQCREVIAQYDQVGRDLSEVPGAPRVALIEMPPFGESIEPLVSANSRCAMGRLTTERQWSAITPLVVYLTEAKVVRSVRDPRRARRQSAASPVIRA